MTTKRLEQIIFGLVCLTPLTLLIVSPDMYFPFITGKAIAFRLLTLVSFALTVYWLLRSRHEVRLTPLHWALLALVGLNLVSMFLSANPFRAFFGNAERMEGWFSMVFYVLYFFVLSVILKNKPRWTQWFIAIILAVSVLQFAVAFTQIASTARADGRFGNATYLGFFGLLSVWFAAYLAMHAKDWLRWFAAITIPLNIGSIILSGSRGSLAGLGVSVLVFLFLLALRARSARLRAGAIALLAVVIISPFLLVAGQRTALVRSMPLVFQRAVAVFGGQDSTTQTRLIVWRMFLNAFRDKPVFGWGPEMSPYVFYHYFDYHLFNLEETIFDRAHNKYIELFVTTGTAGLAAYLSLVALLGYAIWKQKDKTLVFLPLLAGYLANLFFLFDFQGSSMMFMFVLALAAADEHPARAEQEHEHAAAARHESETGAARPWRAWEGALFSAVVLASLFLALMHVQMYADLKSFVTNLLQLRAGDVTGLSNLMPLMQRDTVFAPEFALETGQFMVQYPGVMNTKEGQSALTVLETIAQRENADFRVWVVTVNTLIARYQMTNDSQYLAAADTLLQRGSWINTDFPDYVFIQSSILLQEGKDDQALALMAAIAQKIPRSQRIQRQLFITATEARNPIIATQTLNSLLAGGWTPATPVDYAATILVLELNGNATTAKAFFNEAIRQYPTLKDKFQKDFPQF